MSIVRHAVPGAVLALLVAVATVVIPASAQSVLCFGRPATIEARAGQPTIGTEGDDVIVGTPGADDIRGGAGDDTICGLDGADVISGNGGDDRVSGGKGGDRITGGAGSDDLHGNMGRDAIRGERGDDQIRGGKGSDTIVGGPGDDTMVGGRHDDIMFGNRGNDLLAGRSGNDVQRGGRGADRLIGGRGVDLLLGNRGGDELLGGPGSDRCRGGRDEDTLVSCEVRPDILRAVPGAEIEITVSEGLRADMVGKEFDVWLVPFPDSTAAAHAVAGVAAVGSDHVALDLRIPDSFIELRPAVSGGPPIIGHIEALPQGIYSLWVGGARPEYSLPMRRLTELVVAVTVAGRLEIPDVSDVVVDPSRALLGETGLGDVAFGTPTPAALAALEALFGPPVDDSGWRDGCWNPGPFGRSVSWQGFGVTFHGTDDATGRFVSFVTTGDTALGALTTADGVGVGMRVAEITALTPTSGFSAAGQSIGPAAAWWWADADGYGGSLAGSLSADATDPGATLTSIGNGNPINPYLGC